MIHVTDVSISFAGQVVLDGLSWHVRRGRRIGLVGPNGAGKSTLLKVISGRVTPDSGVVSKGSTTTIGYLHQDVQEQDSENTVLEEALHAFDDVLRLEREVESITRRHRRA